MKHDHLDFFMEDFNEDDDISEHFWWRWDGEESSIQGDFGFQLMIFFEKSFGQSFNSKDYSIDIKLSLLNSAVDELQEFFSVKINRSKFSDIFSELFYTEKRVREMICDEGIKLGFWSDVDVPDKVYEIKNLNLQIPKVKFQWFFFVILSMKGHSGKDLKVLAQRFLKVKWTRSKMPIEINVFNEAQERIRNFVSILKKYEISKNEGYNLSLNIFCFNQATNLFDLGRIFNGVQEKNLSSSKLFEIIDLEGLSIRDRFYSGEIYGEVLHDTNTLLIFNRIFKKCRMLLKNIFEEIAVEENYGLPSKIATAYVTYKYLHNDSSYQDSLLKKIMKLSDIELKIGSEEFENFGMLYKALYSKNAKKAELH